MKDKQQMPLGAALRNCVIFLAGLVVFVAVSLAAYFWVVTRPILYLMHAASPASEQNRKAEQKAIDQFRLRGACEYVGKRTTWRGRPALSFSVNPEFAASETGCIRARTPNGFTLEKDGWL